MEGRLRIRFYGHRDQPGVQAIQARSPGAAPWLPECSDTEGNPLRGWVAEVSGQVIAFLFACCVFDELEILNLAVAPPARRQRVGSGLLREALDWGKRLGAVKAHLEVRESNQAAQHFYAAHGFRLAGRRPKYYSAPEEDALLFASSLT